MKILIVEDEISLASALEHILREDGHFTDMVNDGLSALEYIYGFSYDLILGWTVLRWSARYAKKRSVRLY